MKLRPSSTIESILFILFFGMLLFAYVCVYAGGGLYPAPINVLWGIIYLCFFVAIWIFSIVNLFYNLKKKRDERKNLIREDDRVQDFVRDASPEAPACRRNIRTLWKKRKVAIPFWTLLFILLVILVFFA